MMIKAFDKVVAGVKSKYGVDAGKPGDKVDGKKVDKVDGKAFDKKLDGKFEAKKGFGEDTLSLGKPSKWDDKPEWKKGDATPVWKKGDAQPAPDKAEALDADAEAGDKGVDKADDERVSQAD